MKDCGSIVRVGFGGGCHWCTEAVFQSLRGVIKVKQGWVASSPPDDSFSEAVIVTFNKDSIGLDVLVAIHLRTHSSSSNHAMRGKYRSAVYTFNERQQCEAEGILYKLQDEFDKLLVTRILPFQEFKESDERFRNYYQSNPERPFCRTYIDPKLSLLMREFSDVVKTQSA